MSANPSSHLFRWAICLTFLVSLATGTCTWAEESADAVATEETTHPDEAFPYTLEDISANLVIIKCESGSGITDANGFIAKMDGKTYIFTNQHVLLGVDSIATFITMAGEQLRPKGVELSATRDIARLPIDDRDEALEINGQVDMGIPMAVFGKSEKNAQSSELYGKVSGLGAELVEVTAEFESENSGSPVLNREGQVIGIASYVRVSQPSRMKVNTRFENQTRRFCYRMTDLEWIPVPWRRYNATHGKTYRETEAAYSALVDLINGLYENPFGSVSESWSDAELKSWAYVHNRAVRTSSGGRECSEVEKSAHALSAYCKRRANDLEDTLKKRDLTEFLRDEFKGYKHAYEYASRVVGSFTAK